MRVLILGGTGLTGPHIVRGLIEQGHDVAIFHRGRTPAGLPATTVEVVGDFSELGRHRDQFSSYAPDVVISTMTLTRADARTLVSTFAGIAQRAVVVSSGDVYLAFGRLHGTEPGPAVEMPLTEDSPLRTKLSLGGAGYDKLGVEDEMLSQSDLPATIIRYPAVYGPGDSQHRFYAEVRRMADNRPAIILPESQAGWRFSHSFSEDVAQACVLAATNEAAGGRVYNVAERDTPTVHERLQQLADAFGWTGRILTVPDETLRDPLGLEQLRNVPGYVAPPDMGQHLVIDSTRIREELGYVEKVSVQEGLRRTIKWLLKNPPAGYEPAYAEEDAVLASL